MSISDISVRLKSADRHTVPGLSADKWLVIKKRLENAVLIGVPLSGTIISPFWFISHSVTWIGISSLVVMYLITGFGVGLGLHRYFSHRSFVATPALAWFLGCAGSMAFQGSVLRWVADHRRHHAHTDKCGDVHSPHINSHCASVEVVSGLWHAHVGWMFDGIVTDYQVYAKDLLVDQLVVFFHKTYWVWPIVSLALPFCYGFLISGSGEACSCLLLGGCVRITLLHNAIWSINSFGHRFGSQAYHDHDNSRNNLLLALLTFGEGWHNNHHRFPRSARQGLRPGEIDISGSIIDLLEKIGLVSAVLRVRP